MTNEEQNTLGLKHSDHDDEQQQNHQQNLFCSV